ncbi:MAG: FtsX-like permease family protein [Spirochaetaceae bacterium]|nr:MAG: FtsX-like permease family protein [Spirochaetaceae bacterium]
MWFILSLSLKNLFRYKRRTFLTAIAIAAGIAAFIAIDGVLLGAELESVRNLVKYETGSARIMDSTYWKNHDFLLPKYHLNNRDQILKAVTDAGYAATPRITVLAEVSNAAGNGDQYPCILAGIDPGMDERVFSLKETIVVSPDGVQGQYLSPEKREILLGKELAEKLDAGINDAVMVKTKTASGQYTTLDAVVTGLLYTTDPIINSGMIFMPLSYVEDALLMQGRATDIVINFPEFAELDPEITKIAQAVSGVPGSENTVVKSYLEIASEYLTISQTKRGGTSLILFMVFLIAAIGVSNTMLIAVFERTRETGMMRALGMRSGSILLSLVIEATGIGFIGGLGGVILGILANIYMVNWGLDFSSLMSEMGNIGYRSIGIFKSAWNFSTIGNAFVYGMIYSGIMAIFPACIALRRSITKSLQDK